MKQHAYVQSVNKTTPSSSARNMFNKTTNNLKSSNDDEMKPQNTNNIANQESVLLQVRDSNTSLIIIDQDELNLHNESQVIQKIIEEYEKRLQEQLTLAREDIVRELETQIQVGALTNLIFSQILRLTNVMHIYIDVLRYNCLIGHTSFNNNHNVTTPLINSYIRNFCFSNNFV